MSKKTRKLKSLQGLLRPAKPDRFYDPVHLERGIKIELEHTRSRTTAKRIAKHHIDEFPNYYDNKIGLPEMERRLRKTNNVLKKTPKKRKKISFKDEAIKQGYYRK